MKKLLSKIYIDKEKRKGRKILYETPAPKLRRNIVKIKKFVIIIKQYFSFKKFSLAPEGQPQESPPSLPRELLRTSFW